MKIAIAAFVVAIVAFIGVFVRSYNSGGNSAAPTLGPTTSGFTPGVPTDSTSATKKPTTTASGIPKGGVTKFTFPNGQSYAGGSTDFFRFQKQHIVELRVFSQGNAQLIRVSWLAPESYDAPYGDMHKLASPWSLTLHSSGDQYHAALFVGTDASGNDVTCQIFVDGKLKQSLTAQYSFSRQTCIG